MPTGEKLRAAALAGACGSRGLADFIRSFSGVAALYIYALPEPRLIEHYQKLGFRRLAPEKEKFVHRHVKPKYDDGCIFMYQMLA